MESHNRQKYTIYHTGRGNIMPTKSLSTMILLVLVLLVFSGNAYAQLGTAGVNGVVVDMTGATIAGASISVLKKDTGQLREFVTGENGSFSIESLLPGEYQLMV